MAERAFAPTPEDLRTLVRRQLESSEPGLRLVAENVLALSSTIDLVGVDSQGRAVLVWIAESGGDLETLTRALAGRSWAQPRLRDWAQLSPALKLRPESGPRSLLVCAAFDPDTVAAVASLKGGGIELVLSKPEPGALIPGQLEWVPLEGAPGHELPSDPIEAPSFRSGLSEDDLGLSPEESRSFELPK